VQNQRAVQAGLLCFATATSLLQAGDLFRAETAFRDCLDAVAENPALRCLEGDAAYHLSQVCRLTRRSSEADHLLTLATLAFAQTGPHMMLLRCQIELGWCHLLAGDLDAGRVELDRAASALQVHPQAELETALRISFALSKSLAGASEQADLELHALIAAGHLTQFQLADAAWILARNAEGRHDTEARDSWSATARTAAAEAWWPPQMDRIFS
jgi:hypothetical protein